MKINELNVKYFELYDDLNRAGNYVPPKQLDAMYKALFEQYAQELEVCLMENELENCRALFKLRFNERNYVPRRGFFWRWNKIAKVLLKQYADEFAQELAALEPIADRKDVNILSEEKTESTALQPLQGNGLPTEKNN